MLFNIALAAIVATIFVRLFGWSDDRDFGRPAGA